MYQFIAKKQDSYSSTNQDVLVESDDLKTLAENVYRQNVEILGKNKTLSLLSQLYEISILALEPKEPATKVNQVVLFDLSLELAGILLYKPGEKALEPLAFASSERLYEVQSQCNTSFDSITIKLSDSAFMQGVIAEKHLGYSENLQDVWGSNISNDTFDQITSKAHVRSTILCPLIIQDKVIGVLVLCINRLYNDLVEHEKESIENIMNVIAVALDKALLYTELQELTNYLSQANKRLRELDKQKTEFVSIASHQLRSPLTAITGYTSLLIEGSFGELRPEIVVPIRRVFESGKLMAIAIDDFLNVTRIEQGRMRYDMTTFNVCEVVAKTVDDMHFIAQEKGIQLLFDVQKCGEHYIHADHGKIVQVITNLIDNAIKYTPHGYVHIAVEPTVGNKKIRIYIKDSGIGISKEDQQRLFEKFTRGVNANKTNVHGTGLGLYLAQQLVKAQGGQISVESDGEDSGSTFIIELDAIVPKDDERGKTYHSLVKLT